MSYWEFKEGQNKSRFMRPGFGLTIDFMPTPYNCLFPSALDPMNEIPILPLTTLREFAMLKLMNAITDKPGWNTKVFDDSIASKWKAEALSNQELKLTPACLEWVIEELRYKAGIFRETGAVSIYNGDVVKSDTAITEALKDALKAAIVPLENVSEVERDYHPGSKGKVINLVHPSLFPLVYGRSRAVPNKLIKLDESLKSTGLGQTIPIQRKTSMPYSTRFQWLPCEVELTNLEETSVEGDAGLEGITKITSYINNLHPQKHRSLYGIIEKIISRTIPLWNLTLEPIKDARLYEIRIPFQNTVYDPELSTVASDQKPTQRPDENEDQYWDRLHDWENDYKAEHVVIPEPGVFRKPTRDPTEALDLRQKYRRLQIIVKLASIHLTPDKPAYEGGSWHVEGHMNEHICATGLYYYDNENITESRLAFRQHAGDDASDEFGYEQNDDAWLGPIFGLEQDGTTVQNVGDIICKEGRLITFPNILQHQVQPFRLEDPSKPGHRKILALFLVDPNICVISTANVPPQQRDWWKEQVLHTGVLDRLAPELQDLTFEGVDDFPIGLDEAKKIRLELMDERKEFVVRQDHAFNSFTISLCEH